MSTKRTLVKQKVTYGSVGEENLHDSADEFTVKETSNSTKRVPFESHELSDSDSDEENSLGRINRTSSGRAGDSLDGLFRETNNKESEKGEPKSASRTRPTISPRRTHFETQSTGSKERQFSNEDVGGLLSEDGKNGPKERGDIERPVAPPRTSPGQHRGEKTSPSTTPPKAVARERPGLAKREGELKLFDKGFDVIEDDWRKNVEEDVNDDYTSFRYIKENPLIPIRRRKTIEDDELQDTGISTEVKMYAQQKTKRDSSERPVSLSRGKKLNEDALRRGEDSKNYKFEGTNTLLEKPKAPSRSKVRIEGKQETEEDDGVDKSNTLKHLPEKPMAVSRSKKTLDAENQRQGEYDSGAYEYERTRSLSQKPVVPSRRKKTLEETLEKQTEEDVRTYKYERTKRVSDETHEGIRRDYPVGVKYERKKDSEGKSVDPSRRHEMLEQQPFRSQIPLIRTSTYEDDEPFLGTDDESQLEHLGNLRHGRQRGKVKGRPGMSVVRSDSSEEEDEDEDDSSKALDNRDSFSRQKDGTKKHDIEERDAQEKFFGKVRKPDPPSRATVDDILRAHSKKVQPEEDENDVVKRPGSAPAMKRASSLETMSSTKGLQSKKGPSVDGSQRLLLKKSLTPQRPMSGKKGSLLAQLRQKAQANATATFEEHVPPGENVVSTLAEDRGIRKKGPLGSDVGGFKHELKSRKSGPLRANQEIETMTRSPHPREEARELWADARGTTRRGSVTPKRSSSMTNLRETSPGVWSEDSSGRTSQQSGFMDTETIRQAVYDEWRSRKREKLKDKVQKTSAEKKKLEEKEIQERERKKVAKRAFESWNEMKQEKNKELHAKKKETMEKELDKQTEKNLRARDAAKYFESWKSKKDEELKERHRKKKQEQREKKTKEMDESQEKKKFSQKAFENWKSNKDEKVKEETKKKRKQEKESTMKKEDDAYERSIQCAESYQEWIDKKGRPRRGPPPPTLTQRSWCPSGRKSGHFIPEKVGDVIQKPAPNRSRTMSGSYYFK